MKYLLLFFSIGFMIVSACNNHSNQVDATYIIEDTSLKPILGIDTEKLNVFVQQVLKKNPTGILDIRYDNDTLNIVSDEDLTWKPFGSITNPAVIKNKFAPIFNTKDSVWEDDNTKEKRAGIVLFSPLSTIFFKKMSQEDLQSKADAEMHGKPESLRLYYASIKDTIPLAYQLRVGMSKIDFFTAVFGKYDHDLFKNINVIINSDPPGQELDSYYVFKKGILKEILMQSPY